MATAEFDDHPWSKEKISAMINKARNWEETKKVEGPGYYVPPYQLQLHRPTRAVATVLDQLFPSIADALAYAFEHYLHSDVEHVHVFMTKNGARAWIVDLNMMLAETPVTMSPPSWAMTPPWMHGAKAV